MPHRALESFVATVILFAATSSAYAATLYVANNGLDSAVPACGTKAQPCRSIRFAIQAAVAGDKIVVGPGRYGDLNFNGTVGEPGEEGPTGGCNCLLNVNKTVTLTSSDGAAATLIDAAPTAGPTNVRIDADGVQFGKPGKGFTVTNGDGVGDGIAVTATNVAVRGNQIVNDGHGGTSGIITADEAATILIEGNQVIGRWVNGIRVEGSGKTVRKNVVALATDTGISVPGTAVVVGNVVTGNRFGIFVSQGSSAVGNAVFGNHEDGFLVSSGFTGSVQKNNIFGNTSCGLTNFENAGLAAQNNYWGAATGPGADPADPAGGSCDKAATSLLTPFAVKPFKVKAPIKP